MNSLNLNGRRVGHDAPCFIIAEAGVNHNGDLALAQEMVTTACQAHADAIKFQTFTAEALVTPDAPQAAYQAQNMGVQESQYTMLQRLELSQSMHHVLWEDCQRQNILFMSTPFDAASADVLAELGIAVFKLPSGELTNLPFLRYVAQFGKPLILSTGMGTLGEVEAALNTLYQAGNSQVVVLHCVSNYPANPAEVNLRAMLTLRTAFDVPVGYSDHTLGNEVSLAAVALGACVIEKHFTLDQTLPGPDHKASSEPAELAALIHGIRTIEMALSGDGRKQPSASELDTAAVARKSLVAAHNLPAGAILSEQTIAIKRPGTGLPPAMLPYLIGRRARIEIKAGALLSLDMLA